MPTFDGVQSKSFSVKKDDKDLLPNLEAKVESTQSKHTAVKERKLTAIPTVIPNDKLIKMIKIRKKRSNVKKKGVKTRGKSKR